MGTEDNTMSYLFSYDKSGSHKDEKNIPHIVPSSQWTFQWVDLIKSLKQLCII